MNFFIVAQTRLIRLSKAWKSSEIVSLVTRTESNDNEERNIFHPIKFAINKITRRSLGELKFSHSSMREKNSTLEWFSDNDKKRLS